MEVQEALLDACRFWLERGVDGFRLDTVNFYVHSQGLEDNPPSRPEDRNSPEAPAVNPYNWQDHIHDKSQPENLEFLKRLRALLDRYPAKTTVGEIGDGPRSLKTMAAYTSGGDKLHMCYTFDFLSPVFTPRISATGSPPSRRWSATAGRAGPSPTTTSCATSAAGRRRARSTGTAWRASRSAFFSRSAAPSASTRARSSASTKPNSASRTSPIPTASASGRSTRDGTAAAPRWRGKSNAPNGGFSPAKPWLPLSPDHVAHAVNREAGDPQSMLAHYRRLIAFRRDHPALRSGSIGLLDAPADILAFVRESRGRGGRLRVQFQRRPARFVPPASMKVSALTGHGFAGLLDDRSISLAAGDAFFGTVT